MTRHIDIPFLALIRRADPTFHKDSRSELEYEFGGGRRRFYANPTTRGVYGSDYASDPWILATGYWNDDGVWDDNATWKD